MPVVLLVPIAMQAGITGWLSNELSLWMTGDGILENFEKVITSPMNYSDRMTLYRILVNLRKGEVPSEEEWKILESAVVFVNAGQAINDFFMTASNLINQATHLVTKIPLGVESEIKDFLIEYSIIESGEVSEYIYNSLVKDHVWNCRVVDELGNAQNKGWKLIIEDLESVGVGQEDILPPGGSAVGIAAFDVKDLKGDVEAVVNEVYSTDENLKTGFIEWAVGDGWLPDDGQAAAIYETNKPEIDFDLRIAAARFVKTIAPTDPAHASPLNAMRRYWGSGPGHEVLADFLDDNDQGDAADALEDLAETDPSKPPTNPQKQALQDALEKAANDGTLESGLTDEEEQEVRDKWWGYHKQCVLLSGMNKLGDESAKRRYNLLKSGNVGGTAATPGKQVLPYFGRIVPVRPSAPSHLVNELRCDKNMNIFLSAFFAGEEVGWGKEIKYDAQLSLVKEIPVEKPAAGQPSSKIIEVPISQVSEGYGYLDRIGDQYFTDNVINKDGIQQLNDMGSVTVGSNISLQSISLKLDGSNPSTARRDIKAEIKFTIEDLAWLDRLLETDVEGKTYYWKMVDLMTYPTSYQQGKGFGRVFKRQYNPAYNRLRVSIRPYIKNAALPIDDPTGTVKLLGTNGAGTAIPRQGNLFNYTELVQSSFDNSVLDLNLALIEHSFNIGAKDKDVEQMTYELTIKYAGYFETAMNAPYTDGLADYDTLQSRRDNEEKLEKDLSTADCPQSVVQQIMNKLESKVIAETKLAKSSILKRALLRSKIHKVEFSKAAVARLVTKDGGVIKAYELWDQANIDLARMKTVDAKTAAGDLDETNQDVQEVLSEGEAPEPDNKSDDEPDVVVAAKGPPKYKTPIYFIFVGDLLEIITDCLYEKKNSYDNQRSQMGKGLEHLNMYFMTSTFQFAPMIGAAASSNSPTPSLTMNIADIPLSIAYFREWYEEAVVKKDLPYYSAINMLRDIVEKVVTNLLGEVCFTGAGEKKLRFRVAYVNTAPENNDGEDVDPIFTRWKSVDKDGSYSKYGVGHDDLIYCNDKGELDLNKNTVGLPLLKRNADLNTGKFYNYAIIYAQDSNIYNEENNQGLLLEDVQKGIDGNFLSRIPHLLVGKSIGGAIKTATFTRTDAPYLREARYFNGGIGNLSQLTNVYDVKMEMYGNTFFYPGQLVWIEMSDLEDWGPPTDVGWSLGPPQNAGSPAIPNSLANNLGLGGYHVVKSVNLKWNKADKIMNTSVEATWAFSGHPNEYRRFDPEKPPKVDQQSIGDACQAVLDRIDAEAAAAEVQTVIARNNNPDENPTTE